MILEGGAVVAFFLCKRLNKRFLADGSVVAETNFVLQTTRDKAVIRSRVFGAIAFREDSLQFMSVDTRFVIFGTSLHVRRFVFEGEK
jgi:hypothetical protein